MPGVLALGPFSPFSPHCQRLAPRAVPGQRFLVSPPLPPACVGRAGGGAGRPRWPCCPSGPQAGHRLTMRGDVARAVPIPALGTCWWLPVPCGRGGAMPCVVARSGRRAPALGCRGARAGCSAHGATSPALLPLGCALGVSPGQLVALGTRRVLLARRTTVVSPWLGRRLQLQKMGLHPSQARSKMAFWGRRGTTRPGMLLCAPAAAAPVARHAGGCSARPPTQNTACLGPWHTPVACLPCTRPLPGTGVCSGHSQARF